MKKIFFSSLVILSTSSAFAAVSEVCQRISSLNSANGAACAREISRGGYYQDEAVAVCAAIARSNSIQALQCVKNIKNNGYNHVAAQTCTLVADLNSSNAALCMAVSANKSYYNGSAETCREIARSNSSSAVECLKNSGVVDNTSPVPGPGCVTTRQAKHTLRHTMDNLYRGDIAEAIEQVRWLLSEMCD